jgi:23S rRNA pseudouridine2605 synthase
MSENTRPKVSGTKPARPKTTARADSTPEGERIAKVLSRAGVASRREAERLIELGEVQVNGKTIQSAALNVTASDRITVSGQPVGAPEPARLWLYYKPEGLVTSASDEKGRETVFDHLPEDMPRVMSIGRLDLNSEGLLLLTNDGGLKRQLELPSTGWLRKYRVRVKGNPTDPELEPLRRGIVVDGDRFQPMEVALDRHQGSNAWLTVGLREGKNREIRRAINAIGMIVNRLIRVSYGPFRLNEMEPGQVEEVRARVMRDQLGALLPGATEPDDTPTPAARKPGVRTTSRTGGDSAAPPRRAGPNPKGSAPRDTAAKPASRVKSTAIGKTTPARGQPATGTSSGAANKARTGPHTAEAGRTGETGRTISKGRTFEADIPAKPPTRGRTYKPGPKTRDTDTDTASKTAPRPGPKPGAKPGGRPGARPGGKPPTRRK